MISDIIHCTACGAKNKASHRFCYSCGAKMFEEANDLSETAPLPEPERAPAISASPALPESVPAQLSQNVPFLPVQNRNALRDELLWFSLAVFIISLIFAAYKVYEYSSWIYISSRDWLIPGIAGGVALLALVGVFAFSKRSPEAQLAAPPQEEKNRRARLFFLWLVVIIFILCLGFAFFKVYQYSKWIYVSPQDWLVPGIAGVAALVALIGIERLSRRFRNEAAPALAQPHSTPKQVSFAPVYPPASSFAKQTNLPAAAGFGARAGAAAAEPAKKAALSGWATFFAILVILAVAVGLALSALNGTSGTGSSQGGSDACAEVRSKLEWWKDCDCSSNADMMPCYVKARGAEGCYYDSHGIRMCSAGEGDGFVPRECVERPRQCK